MPYCNGSLHCTSNRQDPSIAKDKGVRLKFSRKNKPTNKLVAEAFQLNMDHEPQRLYLRTFEFSSTALQTLSPLFVLIKAHCPSQSIWSLSAFLDRVHVSGCRNTMDSFLCQHTSKLKLCHCSLHPARAIRSYGNAPQGIFNFVPIFHTRSSPAPP